MDSSSLDFPILHSYGDELEPTSSLSPSDKPIIFIMGLHRSGTTFLYENLSRYFNTAKLGLGEIVYFPHLLDMQKHSTLREKKQTLNEYFASHKYEQRGNDDIPLNADTAEEYGWILKRWGTSFRCHDDTLELMKQIINKLSMLNPCKQALMLKNPWDIGQSDYLAAKFPQAKFIFIRRYASEILISEVNNALHFTSENDPLLKLLSNNIALTRRLTKMFSFLRKTLSHKRFIKLISRLLIADIVTNLKKYQQDLEAIPPDRVYELSYDELVDQPEQIFDTLSIFLSLEKDKSQEIPKPKRSNKIIDPLVKNEIHRLHDKLLKASLDKFVKANP